MDSCAECSALGAPRSGWSGFALAIGALLFCPCHLPVTIGIVGGVGGGALLASNVGLVWGAFGAIWLGVLLAGFVWIVRRRDKEVKFEELHARLGHKD